ncbi:hypothetical protein EDD85DRAFT_217202 [Armillaria nabsnona]|nr:hypothetical protein EDD85DRAFT_217202 [Armillaria nabsnona]
MHVALAIFLGGLVIFLHPLQVALSWIMCTAAALVYTSYVLAAILPIIFPQCPYRTPLCDLIYVSFCRIIPQVSWDNKEYFLIACRRGELGQMFRYLPHVHARNRQSLTMIESKLVRRTSTNLAAEGLDWLFSVSSNPTVQSIVVQCIGGLPMASEEKLLALRGNNTAMDTLRNILLLRCFQTKVNDHLTDPFPGAELKLERLLRFHPRFTPTHSIVTPGIDSFELTAAILSNGYRYAKGGWFIRPITFFMEAISPARPPMLPLHCWSHLVRATAWELDVFSPLDPDNDDHTNTFPLDLCSAILCSFNTSQKGLTQDFNSPLILTFKDALPYFLDKIYDRVLLMLSRFDKNPPLGEAPLPQTLRVFVMAIEFLLHRLSLPEPDKHTIHLSLTTAVGWIRDQTLSLQEATAVIAVLEDILPPCVIPPLDVVADWMTLFNDTILVYRALTIVAPSACSSRGLQFMVEFMSINWDYALDCIYQSDVACWVLTDLLVKRVPVAYTTFLENRCLQFIGNHRLREASSVPFVREYVAGLFAMQRGSNGVVDATMLQQHIDYLHNPINLFTTCSILAIHGLKDIDRTSIYKDITTLVRLCPRNAAWDECRSELCDLVRNDGGDIFSKQLVWTNPGHILRPLQPEEIQVEKDNVSYAIQVLDDFFDGGAHPMVPFDLSPARHTTGRGDRFVG